MAHLSEAAAAKIVEGDKPILDQLELDDNELEALEHIITQMERERGLDRNAAMADMRFSFIRRVCRQAVVKPKESKEHQRSREIDKILTGIWQSRCLWPLWGWSFSSPLM